MREFNWWEQQKAFKDWLATHPDAGKELKEDGDLLIDHRELQADADAEFINRAIGNTK